MKKAMAQRWVNALRSGEYKQGSGKLRTNDGAGNFSYCCLGVLREVENLGGHDYHYLSSSWVKVGLGSEHGKLEVKGVPRSLANLNDTGVHSLDANISNSPFNFDEIADVIQAEYIECVI